MNNLIIKNMTPKILTVMLASMISSTAILGCSQQADDAETVANANQQEAEQPIDYQESRNTGSYNPSIIKKVVTLGLGVVFI